MNYFKNIFLLIFMIVTTLSCIKTKDSWDVSSNGIIQKQGITTYQYGTHILTNNNNQTIYALKSDKINLDDYINKNVEIYGNKISGYPIDGGPEYIEVSIIK